MRFVGDGTLVRIAFRGQTVEAEGYLEAGSGLTKIFLLHCPLREYAVLLPVVWVGNEFVDMLHGESVTIETVPAVKKVV